MHEKVVLLSDLHLMYESPQGRTDNIVEAAQEKLNYVLSFCHSKNMPLVTAADVFDKPRGWRVLTWVSDLLKKWSTVPIYAVRGQHDMYMRSESTEGTCLGLLVKWDRIKLLDDHPTNVVPSAQFYGCSYGDEVPVPWDTDANNILVVHMSISDAPLWPGREYTNAVWFLSHYRYYAGVLCGDIHKKFVFRSETARRWIANTGPLLRKEASVEMFEHHPCFFIYDVTTGSIIEHEIPHKPAAEVLSREHLERKTTISQKLDEFVAAVQHLSDEQPDKRLTFDDNLIAVIKANKVPKRIVTILDEVMEEVDQ